MWLAVFAMSICVWCCYFDNNDGEEEEEKEQRQQGAPAPWVRALFFDLCVLLGLYAFWAHIKTELAWGRWTSQVTACLGFIIWSLRLLFVVHPCVNWMVATSVSFGVVFLFDTFLDRCPVLRHEIRLMGS